MNYPGRRILTDSVEDLMVFSCFGSDDPQHSPPQGSDESETFIRRLRMRRASGSSNLSDVEELLRSSSPVSSRQDWRGFFKTPDNKKGGRAALRDSTNTISLDILK
jgi:hypothetical protein